MELYAGLVENMDHHIGRLVDHLKAIGEYENTIFIVFGDNGAEGTDLFKMIAGSPGSRTTSLPQSTGRRPIPTRGRSGLLRRLRPDVGGRCR